MKNNETHSVLFELQKNLEDLSSAKKQMEEFRTLSLNVVKGLKDVETKYIEHLENIKSEYKGKVAELSKELKSFLSKNQSENKETIKNVVSTSEETLKEGIVKFEKVSKNIETTNDEKIEAINNLLEQYKSVVEASNSLIETLNAVNFPTRLDTIENQTKVGFSKQNKNSKTIKILLYIGIIIGIANIAMWVLWKIMFYE